MWRLQELIQVKLLELYLAHSKASFQVREGKNIPEEKNNFMQIVK